MNNILIVNKEQYGYHIDTYKYCLYLSGKFNITYLCWDDNKNRIATEGISCVYLKRDGNVLNRFLILLKSINLQINKFKYDLVFIFYSLHSFIYSILFDVFINLFYLSIYYFIT